MAYITMITNDSNMKSYTGIRTASWHLIEWFLQKPIKFCHILLLNTCSRTAYMYTNREYKLMSFDLTFSDIEKVLTGQGHPFMHIWNPYILNTYIHVTTQL